MPTQAKTFDCVEMKDRIQAQLLAEYDRRRDEFASFVEFLTARNDESEWVRKARARLATRE